ncbi:MAG: hypothetical protein KAS32_25395, partial [Candidatus Peribacteraceae bacterium]|nr:hypothetical protein [Candidatus Peribacteraceae bacterium]
MKPNIQVLLAINSDHYNENVIKSLEHIYIIHFLKNVDLHIVIMGRDTKLVSDIIPDWVKTKLEINAYAYNYAYATNVLYKSLEGSMNDNFPMILTDGWTITSLLQLFNYEFKNNSLRENVLVSPVYIDNSKKPINFDSTRVLSSVVQRARTIKSREDIPVVITTSEYFYRAGGLEEKLF